MLGITARITAAATGFALTPTASGFAAVAARYERSRCIQRRIITLKDLANYEAKIRTPMRGTYQ